MSDYREGLHLIPEHMHRSISDWIERAEPHPNMMDSFFRAVLTNNLRDAFAHADDDNLRALHGWTQFLYNYAPSACAGSIARVQQWYDSRHT
jgi:hypothetical protein